MKIKYLNIALIPVMGVLFSCSNGNQNEEQAKGVVKIETPAEAVKDIFEYDLKEGESVLTDLTNLPENATIGIAKNSATVDWVSYKTTEKKPVGGTFNEIIIGGINQSNDLATSFTGATVSIPVNSVNSKNEGRDEKIARIFFGTMTNTDIITGTIIEFTENNGVVIEFTMNEVSHKVKAIYAVNNEIFTIDGVIDLADLSAEKAVEALNTECKDLHTGADGVSMLWSEVAIKFTGTLTKK